LISIVVAAARRLRHLHVRPQRFAPLAAAGIAA